MNVLLGILQGLLGVLYLVGGGMKVFMWTFPILTPIAAIGLAVEGVLFAGLHYKYAERSPMMFSLVLAALAAFVAYGRFVLTPL
ncbi:MAG: hypothetical protein DMD71_04105 [Gemmatimonadetes bacterium]|nr:MAG: hypothetical protein DMD74_03315 [Gemmatimonadota bacterium]PYO69680.1 MAG: hypothetical protein DMD71_04105 [Gemmatimonadota bacterium]